MTTAEADMDERIGTFEGGEGLEAEVAVELFPAQFAVRWDQCGATSDFFAAYFSRLPRCRDDEEANGEVEGAISYVLNEVIENAVKFQSGGTITVKVGLDGEELVFVVGNRISESAANALKPRVRELVTGDAQELLLRRVEQNAENPELGVSGLGFLTMITDYEARLGWSFTPVPESPGQVLLHTMARLPIHRT